MTPDDVQRILEWPRETRSTGEQQRLCEYRASVYAEMRALVDEAERFDRGLSADEQQRFDELTGEFDRLGSEVPSAR